MVCPFHCLMGAGAWTVMTWLRPLPPDSWSTPLIIYDAAPWNSLLLAAVPGSCWPPQLWTCKFLWLVPLTPLLVQWNSTYVFDFSLGSHLLQEVTPWQIPTAPCTSSFKNVSLPVYSPVCLACSLTSLLCKLCEPEDSFILFTILSPAPWTAPSELFNQSTVSIKSFMFFYNRQYVSILIYYLLISLIPRHE